MTPASSDFRDIVRALSSERVRFLVVGGMAVVEHTEPRYTKDLDLWIEPSVENAERAHRALKKFGAPVQNLRVSDLTNPDLVYQIGVEPVRIDILMGLEGLDFAKCWKRRATTFWGKLEVPVLGVKDLLANKRRVGRPQDLADVERLRPLVRPTPPGRRKKKT